MSRRLRALPISSLLVGTIVGLGAGVAVAHTQTINGTSGSDAGSSALVGHEHVDIINGFGGGDELLGHAAGDDLNGGTGGDAILGQDGWDDIASGDGTDNSNGFGGQDTVGGESGTDSVEGGGDIDTVRGGPGNFDYVDTANDGAVDYFEGGDGSGDTCEVDIYDAPVNLSHGCEFIN